MGLENTMNAPIDESLGLLNQTNSVALRNLREKYPEFKSILELGVIGGANDLEIDELRLRVEVSKLALLETLKTSKDTFLPKFRRKLKFLQKIELWAQMIIVLSSSTVFGLIGELEKGEFKLTSYVAGGFTLASALLTIILKQNTGEWAMNNHNIANSYGELVKLRIDAEETLREMEILSQFPENNLEKLTKFVEQSNNTNRKMLLIILKHT